MKEKPLLQYHCCGNDAEFVYEVIVICETHYFFEIVLLLGMKLLDLRSVQAYLLTDIKDK